MKTAILNYFVILRVVLKFSFSEKATKIRKNLPLVLKPLSRNSCFVKTGGRFFQILWPSCLNCNEKRKREETLLIGFISSNKPDDNTL
jgi:hypothetical protein